jgi:hypothetical protein
MGIRGFITYQVKQIKILTIKLVKCWHSSHELQSKLRLAEERLIEAQKKNELLINNLDNVRATCPYEDQCPVKDLFP